MNFKKGLAVMVAALALLAVSASSAFAASGSSEAWPEPPGGWSGQANFCEGALGTPATACATVIVPTWQDYLKFDGCLEDSGGFRQLSDVEACAQSTGYQVKPFQVKLKHHHAAHHRASKG